MRTPGRTRRLAVIGFLASVTLALSVGCAHTVLVFPKPPETTAEKVQMDVGLYLTEGFRNYTVSEFRKGDKWNYENLGSASATQFRLELDQTFRTTRNQEGRTVVLLEPLRELLVQRWLFHDLRKSGVRNMVLAGIPSVWQSRATRPASCSTATTS